MSDLASVVRDFTLLFDRLRIEYAVMGGIAVRLYGIPRATYDVDFTISCQRHRLPQLYGAVSALGYTVPDPYLQGWVDEVANMPLVKARLYLGEQGVDIDIFLAESSFQRQVLLRRRREQVDNEIVWFVSPEDLILLKLLARRPRDLADIGDVFFMQGQLDEKYMREWAQQLGVLPDLEGFLGASPASQA